MPSLGNDLAALRKSRGISLDEIHRSTKIPKNVLASIEDNTIFADITNNPAYIRSYVRTYAKALSIEERKIVYALDKVEKGSYIGSLIDDEQRQELQEKNLLSATDAQETNESEQEPASASSGDIWDESSASDSKKIFSKPQQVGSVDWVDMGRQFQPTKSTNPKGRLAFTIIILFVVAAFMVYWFYFRTLNSTTTDTSQEEPTRQTTTTAPDSVELDVIPPTSEDSAGLTNNTASSTQPKEALSDTLSIVVYAAYGKLEPVRVYTDIIGNINPYWIEEGEAIQFNFVNNFQLRGTESNIILLMNGHMLTDFQERFFNPETGRIELTRSFFEGDTKWLQPPSNTLPVDVPRPSIIHQLQQ